MRPRLFGIIFAIVAMPTPSGAQERLVALDGLWAQRIVTASVARLPVIGKVESESRFFALTRISQRGAALNVDVEPCWARVVGDVRRVKTIVPDETVAVMGPRRRQATLSGNTVSFARAVDVLGARLADEWTDPLPQTEAAATAFDEDGDGHPGVTVRIVGPIDGDVYVAQRAWNAMTGTLNAERNRIRGSVRWGAEQQVLGASSIFLRANPKSKPHHDASRSTFEMLRMPSTTTCKDVKRRNDALFGGK